MNSVAIRKSYTDLDDHDLVLACQQRIEAAFSVLYLRHLGYVHGMLNRLAPDMTQNHDDMVQEVFVRVWKSINNLRNPRAFKTWLNRLIKNLFCDELRKKPRGVVMSIDEPQGTLDGDDDGVCLQIADTKARPDEALERDEIIVHIQTALQKLPDHSKNVIILRDVYGVSYEEIAIRTKTEIGTVKSRIARARARMQSHLRQLDCA